MTDTDQERGMKILIADDDPGSRILLSDLLSTYGTCRSVSNGKEAVCEFRQALLNSRPYDLVCLDIMMPAMDGPAALRAIREMEVREDKSVTGNTKIIMVSSLQVDDLCDRNLNAPWNLYLSKPVSPSILEDGLRSLDLL